MGPQNLKLDQKVHILVLAKNLQSIDEVEKF
jgi:hypothetical protein